MDFRSLNKEQLSGQVPCDLATAFREKAGRERKTISELMSELLCAGLELDPAEFGLETVRRRKPEPVTA